MKEDWDTTVAKLEKEIAELKARRVLVKKSAIKEYKSLDDSHEVVVQTTSKYFGKGFDLCKKQINRLHPKLDIQGLGIDNKLTCEEDKSEDEKEDEEKEGDNSE